MRLSLSLRARFTILIGLTLVPVLGGTLYTYLKEKDILAAHVRQDVRMIVATAAANQQIVISSTRQLLAALALNVGNDQGWSECRRMLSDVLDEHPVYSGMGITDMYGARRCSVGTAAPKEIAGEPWFHHAKTVGFALDRWTGDTEGKAGIILSYALQNHAGGFKGVVYAVLDLALLQQFADIELPQGAEYILVSSAGQVIASLPPLGKRAGRRALALPLIREVVSGHQGPTLFHGLDGRERFYGFRPLSTSVDTGLHIAVGLPVSVLDEVKRALALNFLVLAPILMAVAAIWFLTDRFIIRRIDMLAHAAEQLTSGDLTSRTGLNYGSSEIDRLARIFDLMAEAIERQTSRLYDYQGQLRSMASQLLLAEEHERRRIAAELHDRVCQALAISKIRLGALIQSEPVEERRRAVQEVRGLVEGAVHDTRSLIFKISSPILYELGLDAALEWLAEKTEQEHGLRCSFVSDGSEKNVAEDIRILLFQAVGELLVNVVKHAGAREAWICSKHEGQVLSVVVADDGAGFDPIEAGKPRPELEGYGLFSIRERLKCFGGHLEVDSKPGAGTRVTIKVTLNENRNELGAIDRCDSTVN